MTGLLLTDEPMAKYTSWRVGGLAERMYLADGRDDLLVFLATLPADETIFWLGLGSNLLVADEGIQGTVINTRGRLKEMKLIGSTRLYVEAGVACPHVARFATDLGLAGAEFLAGIPGTMGGALKMNAGAFGSETWNIIDRVEMVNRCGEVRQAKMEQFEIGYRSVKGIKDEWFLAAELVLTKTSPELTQQKVKQLLTQRALTQPINKPTSGSVFKNPPGDYAARLIELSGLKGHTIGGACVSEKHANFIENKAKATAADIYTLIRYIQDIVFQRHGVRLQTEVCLVGNFDGIIHV